MSDPDYLPDYLRRDIPLDTLSAHMLDDVIFYQRLSHQASLGITAALWTGENTAEGPRNRRVSCAAQQPTSNESPYPDWVDDETAIDAKQEFIVDQLREISECDVKVTCCCGKSINVAKGYRCLVCGIVFCSVCAAYHFGYELNEIGRYEKVETSE